MNEANGLLKKIQLIKDVISSQQSMQRAANLKKENFKLLMF